MAGELQSAAYGSFFYGQLELDATSQFCAATDALYLLTRQLNSLTRFACVGLRRDANAISAENVLAWSSSFPFAIRCEKQASKINRAILNPSFNYNQWSASSVLNRGECDAVLVGSTESLNQLSSSGRKHLDRIEPIFLVDEFHDRPNANTSGAENAIVIPVAGESGDWCRMDDVALPLKSEPSKLKSSREVLELILAGLKTESSSPAHPRN